MSAPPELDPFITEGDEMTHESRCPDVFINAIEIARGQEAWLLHLRAACDPALLWRDIGANDDPRVLLKPILATIDGGETAHDVRNARSLLAELV